MSTLPHCGPNTSYYYQSCDDRDNSSVPATEFERNCRPYLPHDTKEMRLIIETKVFPCVIALILVTNVSICVVLTRKHMITPTNIILLSMAVADMLTGLFPLPIYVLKNFAFYEMNWNVWMAYTKFILAVYFPTVFHTASIWLTVVLAVQRFIYISFPTRVHQLCTKRLSVIMTFIIYAVALAFHGQLLTSRFQFFNLVCSPNQAVHRHSRDPHEVQGVQLQRTYTMVMKCDWSAHTSMLVYYSLRTLFMNLLPCTGLTIFTLMLVYAMHQAAQRRSRLLFKTPTNHPITAPAIVKTSPESKSFIHKTKKALSKNKTSLLSSTSSNEPQTQPTPRRCAKENSTTSQMLLVVVALFLIVEIPNGILISIYMVKMMFNVTFAIIDEETWEALSTICNIATLVSYPVNFFVYCVMSTQFRTTYKELFGCKRYNSPRRSHRDVRADSCSMIALQVPNDQVEKTVCISPRSSFKINEPNT